MFGIRRDLDLVNRMWGRVSLLLPPAQGRAVQGGWLGLLRRGVYAFWNGTRWENLPRCFPSAATCRRRVGDWRRAGAWAPVWRIARAELQAARVKDPAGLFRHRADVAESVAFFTTGRVGVWPVNSAWYELVATRFPPPPGTSTLPER